MTEIEVKGWHTLLIDEVLNPFYIFQVIMEIFNLINTGARFSALLFGTLRTTEALLSSYLLFQQSQSHRL